MDKINKGIRKIKITFQEKEYRSLRDLCQVFELDSVKVQSLVDNRGITRVEAVALSLKHKGNVPRERMGIEVTVKGKVFRGLSAACRAYSVYPSTVKKLVTAKGLSYEEAILELSKKK